MNLKKVTSRYAQVIDRGRYVQATPPDGLKIFFDKADDSIYR